MRKFFTKKLALTVTVASLLAVQVSGVAAATFSDYVNNYVTASDSTQTDVTTPQLGLTPSSTILASGRSCLNSGLILCSVRISL